MRISHEIREDARQQGLTQMAQKFREQGELYVRAEES
jgi:hypothetical protein